MLWEKSNQRAPYNICRKRLLPYIDHRLPFSFYVLINASIRSDKKKDILFI